MNILGLAGPPGSGKTTLAWALTAQWGPGTATIPVDGFHLPNATLEERGLADRKGAPDTYDVPALIKFLEALRDPKRGDLTAPDYSRELHEPVADAIEIPAAITTVILEGNYLGLNRAPWNEVRPLLDLLWYIDQPWPVTSKRLIARRVETGRDVTEARKWVESVDRDNDALVRSKTRSVDRVITPEELR
ncbi:hypothetical protein [Demequina flava]|uniref:hypothetical protein n=1 Tax=Demequina flava TaxID=1095025 RepID=UPI000786557B|nr:hypothetical protein [Demequina flava]